MASSSAPVSKQSRFGWLGAFIWPIHRNELKRFLPMLLVIFLFSFNYNILRTAKDTLVMTAGKNSGGAAIAYIKVYAMLPGAILITALYAWLGNRFRRETVLYIMVSGFVAFFLAFIFLVYPNQAALQPDRFCDYLESQCWTGLQAMISMLRYWTYTVFYVVSELWGTVVLHLLVWGIANESLARDEAKRFYGLFGIGTGVSTILAGMLTEGYSIGTVPVNLPFAVDPWHATLSAMVLTISVSAVIGLAVFAWVNKYGFDRKSGDATCEASAKRAKPQVKMSMWSAFKYLMQNRLLLCIAGLVLAYNMVINLVEVIWKDEVRHLISDKNALNAYMSQVQTYVGYVATFIAIFVSGNVMRFMSWSRAAMITPIIMLITSVGFFAFYFFPQQDAMQILGWSIAPAAIAVFFGAAQNVMSRAAKYTVFDSSNNFAFISMPAESRQKGKAAIDGVGSRLGKSGGAVIHTFLLMICGSLGASSPFIALSVLVIIGAWMLAIRVLAKELETTESNEQAVIKTSSESKPEVQAAAQ